MVNDEARMTTDETMTKSEARKLGARETLRHSLFGFHSTFDIRHFSHDPNWNWLRYSPAWSEPKTDLGRRRNSLPARTGRTFRRGCFVPRDRGCVAGRDLRRRHRPTFSRHR